MYVRMLYVIQSFVIDLTDNSFHLKEVLLELNGMKFLSNEKKHPSNQSEKTNICKSCNHSLSTYLST